MYRQDRHHSETGSPSGFIPHPARQVPHGGDLARMKLVLRGGQFRRKPAIPRHVSSPSTVAQHYKALSLSSLLQTHPGCYKHGALLLCEGILNRPPATRMSCVTEHG